MKTLGVIGGLGPLATAYFLELLVKFSDVKSDQEHLDSIIFNHPSIADRTAYILDNTKISPLPEIVRIGKLLKDSGAELIAIPCVTSHYFYNSIVEGIGLPMMNMLDSTVTFLKNRDVKKAGIMATTGTVTTSLFQNTLKKAGIDSVVPNTEYQEKVMNIIYGCIKAGKPADKNEFDSIVEHLRGKGADSIILGCTELSLIKRDFSLDSSFADALELLAVNCLKHFDLPIKNFKE